MTIIDSIVGDEDANASYAASRTIDEGAAALDANQVAHRRAMLSWEVAITEKSTNTDEPFLVMRAGREPGRISVLLVNPTAADLIDVAVQTGGHYSDDSVGVVESSAKDKAFGRVAAGGWTEIEHPEQDELDEFVVWWNISYGHDVRTSTMFALFKGRDAVGCAAVPVLGGSGALIPRSA